MLLDESSVKRFGIFWKDELLIIIIYAKEAINELIKIIFYFSVQSIMYLIMVFKKEIISC